MKKQEAILPGPRNMIVIVGGGFAGGTLAQRLERSLPAQVEITVISADNHLVFTPMFPEVVGRTISPLHVVVAGRQLTRRTNWLEARVSRIDRNNNEAHYVLRDGATAQFAVRQARQLGDNLGRTLSGAETKPFYFHPRGMLATIGNRNAVATIYGIRLSGFLAWFLWRGTYLAKLPTFRRKLEVAINWACSVPFPPNIVQLRPSQKRSPPPEGERAGPISDGKAVPGYQARL